MSVEVLALSVTVGLAALGAVWHLRGMLADVLAQGARLEALMREHQRRADALEERVEAHAAMLHAHEREIVETRFRVAHLE